MSRARLARRLLGPATITTLLLALPVQAQTAATVDPRFTPWIGCWRPVDTGTGLEELDGDQQPTRACVVPSASTAGTVDLVLFRRDSLLSRTPMPVPGKAVPRTVDECHGTERAEWTADNARLVLKAELSCARGVRRVETGLMTMNDAGQWVQLQHLSVGKNEATTVARFRFEGDRDMPAGLEVGSQHSSRALRVVIGAPVGIDDVIGTVGLVPPSLAEAWLSELGQRFALDARTLVQMADGGVPSRVIDVMVALANPERFAIGPAMTDARGESQGRAIAALRPDRGTMNTMQSRCAMLDDFCYGPGGMGAWGLGYRYGMLDPWGFGYFNPYRYGIGGLGGMGGMGGWGWNRFSPWGGIGWNGGWGGGFGPGVFYGGGPVVIVPTGSAANDASAPVRGRAVQGGGYTRAPSEGSAGRSGGYSPPASERMGGGSSAGGGMGSSGSSSGGSGGGERTAKPRGSGGL